MIEMVPLCFRVVDDLARPPSYDSTLLGDAGANGERGQGVKGKDGAGGTEKKRGGKGSLEGSADGGKEGSMGYGRGGSTEGMGGGSMGGGGGEEEEGKRELVKRRLEEAGYRVGLGIVERCVYAPSFPFLPTRPFPPRMHILQSAPLQGLTPTSHLQLHNPAGWEDI